MMLLSAACSDDTSGSAGSDAEDTAPDSVADTVGDGDLAGDDLDGDGDVAPDAPLDAPDDVLDLGDGGGPFPVIARTPAAPGEDGDGADDITAALGAGEVRAGRVQSFDHGFGGVEVDCRPGDLKLYNARVAFCIAGTAPINLWTYSGGVVIDADRVGAQNDRFFAMWPNNAFNMAGADEVVVVSDGGDGLAVVAARGGEEPLRLAYDLLGTWLPTRGVIFETEYRLRPDVDYLEIVTWVKSPNRRQALSIGDLVIFGDTTSTFFPGYGRVIPPDNTTWDLVTAQADGRSYGLYTPSGMVNLAIDLAELGANLPATGAVSGRGVIEQGGEGVIRRYLLVGDGGTAELREQIAAIDGEAPPAGTLLATVSSAGTPVAGERLLLTDAGGVPRDLVVTDAEGHARAALPAGTWGVAPEDWIGGDVAPVEVVVGASGEVDAALDLPEPARLDVTVTADLGAGDPTPSPAKVEIFGPRHERFFTTDGHVSAPVQPGAYQVVVSRGEAYSALAEAVTVEAGQTWERAVLLERLWDTAGYISGEFHQHMTRSVDSQVPERDRLLSNIAEGVDFVVPSDHDSITDYAPLIAEYELGDLIYAMPSSEVSPITVHLNPMPMTFDPALPAGGAIPLATLHDGLADIKTFPELVSELRSDYGAEVIQVNHPRSNSALFDTVGYDPVSGPDAVDPNRFSTDFDTVEVLNDSGELCRVFTDWLSLVARGHRITGVGNTDTHSLDTEAGWPRNYLRSDAAGPGEITDDDILDALLAGQVLVSRGALIDFPGGPLPGDLVDVSADPTFTLPIRVQTPPWSTIEQLEIWVGATRVSTLTPAVGADAVVTIETDLTLDRPAADTYLVAVAWDDDRVPLVAAGVLPIGFTNPIYLDVDGDGSWTPPGVDGEDDLVRLQIPWCD